MRLTGFIWGIVGVIGLLGFAIYRLFPFAVELADFDLSWWQIGVLIAWCGFMVIAEGWQAFGKQFSPRVVARAQYLRRKTTLRRTILAPVFCIGYFGASWRRIIVSTSLIIGIIILIVIVHFIPQPWRGIVDSGVILGLAYGIGSIVYFASKALGSSNKYVTDPEVVD